MGATAAHPHTPFVDLGAQRAALGEALKQACADVLARGDYVLGADVARFEEEFASYCGARCAVGVDTGTSALELALRAYGIGPGDEVITAANTFIATVFAIAHTGATPVLVDVDPLSYTLDPALLSAAVNERTRAIVPVHLYGQPAEMSGIRAVAREHDLIVIEDACQAHGARCRRRRAGALGHAAAFSFYPSKNLGAHGDGGMVVTDDEVVAERLRMLRNYGETRKHRSEIVGYNRRLDTLQAAMLRVKLPFLDAWNDARRAIAARYDELLEGAPVVRPFVRSGVAHAWHLYVVRVPDRDALREHLSGNGIDTQVHYPVPVHLQPACRSLGYARGDFPVSERCAGEVLSLPMYPELSRDAVARVAKAVHEASAAYALQELA